MLLATSLAAGSVGAIGENEPTSPTLPALRSVPEVAASAAFEIATVGEGFVAIFDVVVTSDGSSYVVGQFTGRLVVGTGNATLTLDAPGEMAGFVAGFDPDNQPRWAQLAGTGAQRSRSMERTPLVSPGPSRALVPSAADRRRWS